jgi:hypothetical protein
MKKPRNGRPIWNKEWNKTRPPYRGTAGVFRVILVRLNDGREYKWAGGAPSEDIAEARAMRAHGIRPEQMMCTLTARIRKRGGK